MSEATRTKAKGTLDQAFETLRVDTCGPGLSLLTEEVTVWLGPRLHVVHYPVRGGEWLNVVALVHGRVDAGLPPRGARAARACTDA